MNLSRVNFYSIVEVSFSPMVSEWAGGQAAGESLSGLYLRNHKVLGS